MNLSNLLSEQKERAVTQMMGKPTCTRQNGCGLPFIQGRECYDGELCEDVMLKPAETERELRAVLDSYGRGLLAGVREAVDGMKKDTGTYLDQRRPLLYNSAVSDILALLDEAMKV